MSEIRTFETGHIFSERPDRHLRGPDVFYTKPPRGSRVVTGPNGLQFAVSPDGFVWMWIEDGGDILWLPHEAGAMWDGTQVVLSDAETSRNARSHGDMSHREKLKHCYDEEERRARERGGTPDTELLKLLAEWPNVRS